MVWSRRRNSWGLHFRFETRQSIVQGGFDPYVIWSQVVLSATSLWLSRFLLSRNSVCTGNTVLIYVWSHEIPNSDYSFELQNPLHRDFQTWLSIAVSRGALGSGNIWGNSWGLSRALGFLNDP